MRSPILCILHPILGHKQKKDEVGVIWGRPTWKKIEDKILVAKPETKISSHRWDDNIKTVNRKISIYMYQLV
jgi:hypothetical protein